MGYKAGYQEMEQRDSTDTVVKAGVVGKKSPFATSTNDGIYDVIAENFRSLKYDLDNIAGTEELTRIKADIRSMYDALTNDPNYGSVTATAQAALAKTYAEQAVKALTELETSIAKVEDDRTTVKELLDNTRTNLQLLTKRMAEATEKTVTLEEFERSAQENLQRKTEELTTALTSIRDETQAIQTTMQGEHATLRTEVEAIRDTATAWAVSPASPDGAADTESPTGETMSARSWSIYTKEYLLGLFVGSFQKDSDGDYSIREEECMSVLRDELGDTAINTQIPTGIIYDMHGDYMIKELD